MSKRIKKYVCAHSDSCAARKNRLQYIVRAIDDEIFEETGERYAFERYIKFIRFDDLYSFSNIFISSGICAAGFRRRPDTFFFMHGRSCHCEELLDKLRSGTFKPRYFPKRQILEHKKIRNIRPPYFECKTVQKVICELLLRPVLEHSMIYHSNASVSGRGTGKLYADVEKHLNKAFRLYGKDGVVIKADDSNYFGSIDREAGLYTRYKGIFADKRFAEFLMLFDKGEAGLSLGNETSQIPASAYTSPIDHYFKDRLGVKVYDRYMDDTIFCCHKSDAQMLIDKLKELTRGMGLVLKDEKVHIQPLGTEVVFCKEHFKFGHGEYYRLPNPDIERTIRRKVLEYGELVRSGDKEKKRAMNYLKGMLNSYRKHPNVAKKVREFEGMIIQEGLNWWSV